MVRDLRPGWNPEKDVGIGLPGSPSSTASSQPFGMKAGPAQRPALQPPRSQQALPSSTGLAANRETMERPWLFNSLSGGRQERQQSPTIDQKAHLGRPTAGRLNPKK
jgi:hypothetical protein